MIKKIRINEARTVSGYRDKYSDVSDFVLDVKIDANLKELSGYIVVKLGDILREEGLDKAIKISEDSIVKDTIFILLTSINNEDVYVETSYNYDVDILTNQIVLQCSMRRNGHLLNVSNLMDLDEYLRMAVYELYDKIV